MSTRWSSSSASSRSGGSESCAPTACSHPSGWSIRLALTWYPARSRTKPAQSTHIRSSTAYQSRTEASLRRTEAFRLNFSAVVSRRASGIAGSRVIAPAVSSATSRSLAARTVFGSPGRSPKVASTSSYA